MRDRRDDERSFRGPMGMGREEGRDDDRFRDHDRDREWERERSWRRTQDMGGSGWSGASGRGGYESRDNRDDSRDDSPGRADREAIYRNDDHRGDYRDPFGGTRRMGEEGGYGGGWGGQRDHSGMNAYGGRQEDDRQYGRDFDRYGEARGYDRDRDRGRDDYDDRPRNLGARDYETRHFGGGRGGFERGGYSSGGPGRSVDRGFGGSAMTSGWQGSFGGGEYGRGASMGRPQGMQSVLGGRGGGMGGEGWGERMGGSDLGFSFRGHEGHDQVEERGPHYGKGPKGYKRSDDRVREDVCDCIARQGHIDASDVEVKVENGTVILSGTVGQRHHKRVLEQMVERLHGVDDVRNELRLKRDEQTQARSQQQHGSQQNGDQPRSSQMPNGKNARA